MKMNLVLSLVVVFSPLARCMDVSSLVSSDLALLVLARPFSTRFDTTRLVMALWCCATRVHHSSYLLVSPTPVLLCFDPSLRSIASLPSFCSQAVVRVRRAEQQSTASFNRPKPSMLSLLLSQPSFDEHVVCLRGSYPSFFRRLLFRVPACVLFGFGQFFLISFVFELGNNTLNSIGYYFYFPLLVVDLGPRSSRTFVTD